jgi:flagellar protein FliS
MFATAPASHAARVSQAYGRVAVESAALGADRHQLIALLLSHSLGSIAHARNALARRDLQAKIAAATKAIRLVEEGLKAAVDRSVGPLGEQLYQLYDYCGRRLLQAHLRNDDRAFAEVADLIGQIDDAWRTIAPGAEQRPALRAAS